MFLATKIAPPRVNARWVRRPRLLSRLGVPAKSRVNIVHAGPGFGKTALLAHWQHDLGRAGIPVAWLSVDPKDDDIHIFIAYLAAAINRVCPEVGRDVIDLITRSGQLVQPASLLVPLANALAEFQSPLVLIVDDFHFLTSGAIQDWAMEFLECMPENLSIAVAARTFPPQRLSRLRAAGQIEEIGPDDLALNFEEVSECLAATGEVTLTAGEVDAVHGRTEGWAAGLQMISIALRGKRSVGTSIESFTGTARTVSGYLQQEVLAGLPAELREFLGRTAVLDRFCADVATVVAGVPNAAQLIAEVERRELFILPLDGEGRWYRYHPLFADFLIAELKRREPQALAGLHARARQWFAAQGLWREAVHHAIEAQDFDSAVEVANRCAMNLVRDGEYFVLRSLLTRLPIDLQRKSVPLRLAEAWLLALNGQGDAVDAILQGIDAESEASGAAAHAPEIQAIRLTLAYVQDDSERMATLLREPQGNQVGVQPWVADVLRVGAGVFHLWHGRYAEVRDSIACTTVFKRVFQLLLFGWSWWHEGRVAEAETSWHAAADLADSESGARSLAALLPRILLARLDYEAGRFDQVERALAGRIGVLEQVCTTDLMAGATYALAWSRAARGKAEDAIALFDRMRLLGAERGWVRMEVGAIVELLRLTTGTRPDQAAFLAKRLQAIGPATSRNDFSTHWLGARLCALGVAYHRGMTGLGDDHVRALEAVVRDLCDLGPPPDSVTALLMLAQCWHVHGQRDRALEAMGRALTLAQGLSLVQTIVDCGDWAQELVHELQTKPDGRPAGLRDDYLQSLRRSVGDECPPVATVPASAQPDALVEPLTRRERDILSLVGRGLSNKEIGRALQIGPETVKWHLKNTFGKLGVATRIQAMRRAAELAIAD